MDPRNFAIPAQFAEYRKPPSSMPKLEGNEAYGKVVARAETVPPRRLFAGSSGPFAYGTDATGYGRSLAKPISTGRAIISPDTPRPPRQQRGESTANRLLREVVEMGECIANQSIEAQERMQQRTPSLLQMLSMKTDEQTSRFE